MADPLTHLQQRLNDSWLIGVDNDEFSQLVQQRLQILTSRPHSGSPATVLLLEPNPTYFLAGFFAACAAHCSVFLGNPHWTFTEQQNVLVLANPDLIWSNGTTEWTSRKRESPCAALANSPLVLIPTGGSSGQVRFVIHTWETLTAAVEGFSTYFPQNSVNSCCLLPLYHVSGLMQALRSFVSGGALAVFSFKLLETGTPLPFDSSDHSADFDPANFFLSLVPTQLQRSLQWPQQREWLARFHTVFLGGAPAWDDLLTQARQSQIRLAPTYGMTETAAQVATLRPDDFLQGQSGCGQALPHAQISICDEDGQALRSNQVGRVVIRSKSLAWGYVGDRPFSTECFESDDLGYLDEAGGLHIVGRSSDKIITGGENVFASEVEAAIRATGLVQDVCVVGVGDRHWGEIVTAFYVPSHKATELAQLSRALQPILSKFKQPKRWIAVAQIPRNAQGKINRQQLQSY